MSTLHKFVNILALVFYSCLFVIFVSASGLFAKGGPGIGVLVNGVYYSDIGSLIGGAIFDPASPGTIGGTTPGAATFTTVGIGAIGLTPLTAAPTSPVNGQFYNADGDNWNPDASITGGVPYLVRYCSTCGTGGAPKYVAVMDNSGNLFVNRPGQIVATFQNGTSALSTTGAGSIARVHKPYAIKEIKTWTLTCDQGESDSTPIIVNVGGKARTAATSGALPTIAANGFCGTGTPPTGNSSTAIAQAAWDCAVTSAAADFDWVFQITQAPTASTACTLTLEVTE